MSYFLALINFEHTFSHVDFMYFSVIFMSSLALVHSGLHGKRFRIIKHVICIICLKHYSTEFVVINPQCLTLFLLHIEMLLHAFYVRYRVYYITIPAKVTALPEVFLLFRCLF